MSEKVKRLTPKPETLRELFVRSGNQCAFPGCLHTIVDSEGRYIAQLCHIEAAERGGQRFNEKQSNEQRRDISNLLLLCYRHHVVTNDVSEFQVPKMKQIKADHEEKFAGLLSAIGSDIEDLSKVHQPMVPEELNPGTLEIFKNFDEPGEVLKAINELVELLQRAAPATRKVYTIIVDRADEESRDVDFTDILTVLSMSRDESMAAFHLLEQYGLCSDNEDQWLPDRAIKLTDSGSGWGYPVALCLRSFCEQTGADLRTMLVELDFRVIGPESE